MQAALTAAVMACVVSAFGVAQAFILGHAYVKLDAVKSTSMHIRFVLVHIT